MTGPKIKTRRPIKILPRRKKTELKALTEQPENVNTVDKHTMDIHLQKNQKKEHDIIHV
jgi:hypothetical protein